VELKRSILMRLAAVGFIGLLTTVGASGSLVAASPHVVSAPQSGTPSAVSSFQGCVASTHTPVSVLVLMDRTQSLENLPGQPGTDPQSIRTIGLKAALREMASAHDLNSQISYKVEMVGFGKSPQPQSGPGLSQWWPVTTSNLPKLYTSAEAVSRVLQGEQGAYTNFLSALQFADATLSKTPAGSCRALLWFTDGALDLSNNGQLFPSGAAEQNAMSSICHPFGVADSLVQDGISSFSVGLTNHTGIRGAATLESIVSGAQGNYLFAGACGANPNGPATSATTGAYFGTPTAANLIFQMQRLVCTGSQCSPRQQIPCIQGAVPCPANEFYSFWVGPGVSAFTIDGLASQIPVGANMQVELADKATRQHLVILNSGGRWLCTTSAGRSTACAIDGVSIAATSLTHGEVRVVGKVNPSATWHQLSAVYLVPRGTPGTVSQTFFEKAAVQYAVQLANSSSATCPSAPSATAFEAYAGCPLVREIQLVSSATGQPVASGSASVRGIVAALGQVPLQVTTPSTSGNGRSVGTISTTVPSSTQLGQTPLRVTGQLVLLDHGIPRVSIDLSFEHQLTILTPPGFPTIEVPEQETVVQVGNSFTTMVTVVPAKSGTGGCIALASTGIGVRGPSDLRVRALHTSIPTTCTRVSGTETFTVSGTLAGGSDGPFTIAVPFVLGSATMAHLVQQPIVVLHYRSNVPVNVGGSILLFIVLILAGLIGILAVAFVVNRVTGKFPPLITVMMRTVDVRFAEAAAVLENADGTALTFDPLLATDLVNPGESVAVQRFSRDGLNFRATAGSGPRAWLLGLFTGPQAAVDAGGSIFISGVESAVAEPSTDPQAIPLLLNRLWVFKVTETQGFSAASDASMLGGETPARVLTGTLSVLLMVGEGPDGLASVLRRVSPAIKQRFDALGGMTHAKHESASGDATGPDAGPSAPPIDPSMLDL